MLNLDFLTRFNRVVEPLPVLQPRIRQRPVVIACQQQRAVNITRQARQLIAIAVAKVVSKGLFQFRGGAREVDIGKALEGVGKFRLRFFIKKRAPASVTSHSVNSSFAIADGTSHTAVSAETAEVSVASAWVSRSRK